jgi:hypothetical protein
VFTKEASAGIFAGDSGVKSKEPETGESFDIRRDSLGKSTWQLGGHEKGTEQARPNWSVTGQLIEWLQFRIPTYRMEVP